MDDRRPQSEHGFAFPISDRLYEKTARVIHQLRQDTTRSSSVPLLLEVVIEAVDVGLDYFLIYPLEIARVNRLTISTAKMAVLTAKQALYAIVRRVLPSMNDEQLLAVAGFLETCLSRLGKAHPAGG